MSQPQPKESEIQRAILEFLKLKGVFCWRQNTAAFRLEHKGKSRMVRAGFPGVSDILGVIGGMIPTKEFIYDPGTFFAIEVKRPGKKPTLDQIAFLNAVKANGGIAFVASSVDDVRRELGL